MGAAHLKVELSKPTTKDLTCASDCTSLQVNHCTCDMQISVGVFLKNIYVYFFQQFLWVNFFVRRKEWQPAMKYSTTTNPLFSIPSKHLLYL